ncbi:MAG: glycoside hydrolase family 38 C-terminal domain-containing protein [Pseudomonadota bacterium]
MKHKLNWTPQKIAARLKLVRGMVYRRHHALPPFRYARLPGPEAPPPVAADVDDSGWEVIAPHSYWGAWSTDFILRSEFQVPGDWDPSAEIALHLPLGEAGDIFCHPEALAYIDGRVVASADRYHHELLLPETYRDGATHRLALHGWTGLSGWPPDPNAQTRLFMRDCAVVEIDRPTRDFLIHAELALEIALELEEHHHAKARLLYALDAACHLLDTREPIRTEAFYASVGPALAALDGGLHDAGFPMDFDLVAVGHAHMDIAYLWQVAQARRKTGRTFANMLRLMDEHPDFRFSQSQPQLYEFLEQDYPDVFKGVQDKVAQGQWEVMGGMWVEPDCNITGAEALVRQLVLGRRYYQDKFGDAETPVLWLPDTFGFTFSLPQLMKQAGLRWFVTNKVNWNQYNPMPAQLIWWQGLDGTRVLVHFLTTPRDVQYLPYPTTYKAEMTAEEVMGTWRNFRQKGAHKELMIAYGYGDGGGGPTRALIEKANALRRLPGAPRVRKGTVREFFERLERDGTDHLPVWNDEIYLELHRGTLTSQSRTKWMNRRCETRLHDAEFLAAYAGLSGAAYPHEAFDRAWKLLCLNQFHDILPGCSIAEVYKDTARDHATISGIARRASETALEALAGDTPPDTTMLAANPAPVGGRRTAFVPGAGAKHDDHGDGGNGGGDGGGLRDLRSGAALPSQRVEGGHLYQLADVPAYGLIALGGGGGGGPAAAETRLTAAMVAGGAVLENDLIRIDIAPNGEVSGIYDKQAQREVLKPGETGNQLILFEDRPLVWDAWDIDIFYEEHQERLTEVTRLEVVETGPLRAAVLVERRFRNSTVTQKIRLHHDSKQIDFDTRLNWHESQYLLKAAFPVDVFAQFATYDIQWGNITRPTHRNTSWDMARFEVPAQKWADLSEGGYGVALLNDSKYGYDVKDDVIRLTLLKCATMPDPKADQGEHHMVYALLPHTGDWRGQVPAAAIALNDPLILTPVTGGTGVAAERALVRCDGPNVILETVKAADDGRGLIVRLFENERSRGPVTLTFDRPVAQATLCDLLEAAIGPVRHAGAEVHVNLAPYEIATLRVTFAEGS